MTLTDYADYITLHSITLHYIFGGSERSQLQLHYNFETRHTQNDACINGKSTQILDFLLEFALSEVEEQ